MQNCRTSLLLSTQLLETVRPYTLYVGVHVRKCMHTWRTSLFSSSQRLETLSMASLCIAGASASSFVKCLCASAAAFSPSPHPCVCVCVLGVSLGVRARYVFLFLLLVHPMQSASPRTAFARICSHLLAFAHYAHNTLVSALLRTAFADCSTCVCVCARARASVCVRMFPYVSVCVRKCPHVSVCSAQHFYWQLWEIRQLIRTWRILILSFLILLYTYTYKHHIYM